MSAEELATVVDLDHDGRGVARIAGKAVFVPGALPGEQVKLRRTRRHAKHDDAELLEVVVASPARVEPRCPHFGRCGGCALQHLSPEAQVESKARELLEQLERIGHVRPEAVLPPLTGAQFGYRRRARLGVKHLRRTGRTFVGFRERTTPFLADVRHCHVLADPVGALCEPLGLMVGGLSIADRLPQFEVSVGEQVTVLVARVLDPPSADDLERMRAFARDHRVEFWLQPAGRDSIQPLDPATTALDYRLPEFDVTLEFGPLDFVQVNTGLNEQMVRQAIDLLAPEPEDQVLDLFCGLGNFTLPLARRAGRVLGVEGEQSLVDRGRANAARNGLANARFALADLTLSPEREVWARESYDRVLLDPPRAGAVALLPFIAGLRPKRMVYVSCHPASLARDVGLLVAEHGFRLVSAGVMDMFPHTAHVESIAVLEPTR
jgi:23S rRNA (uracil1939-C5)-methyltransferase